MVEYMNEYKFNDTATYLKTIKKLQKRYPHISNDIENFIQNVHLPEDLGVHLGNDIYKARIKNSDKHKGKSAGYRLISLLKVIDNEIYLLFVYDKSDFENLSDSDIMELITNNTI